MPPPRWYLDELAHAGPEHLDACYVERYDAKAGPSADPDADIDLLVHHGMSQDSRVLDLGAGTGRFALGVAPHCRQVTALDISPPMVDHVARAAARSGVRNVVTERAGFLSFEFEPGSFDVVYSRHALHQLPDSWKAVALYRVASALKEGGLFLLRDLILSFEPGELTERVEAWLSASAAASTEVGWTREEFETHLRDEHSPFSWALEMMLDHAGLRVELSEPGPYPCVYGRYLCVRK
jgi:SAM-dependent methyltransferase